MTSSTTIHPGGAGLAPHRRGPGPVGTWLYLIALMIVAMVVVGGATRLTESGLSITEWQPIHGVIPPLNAGEWQEEFAKYRKIPQYEILNAGMTLAEFKTIFWWEWAHRLLGRLIGVAFLLPLVFFWATGRIEPKLRLPLAGLFLLGGVQGGVGWWMVASGLSQRTDVSQYRLAVHLTLACAILAYVVWIARGLSAFRLPRASARLRLVAGLIVGLVLSQVFLGGIVAGLDAGMTFNTWPLIDGAIIPSGLFIQEPSWRNLFEDAVTVQFDHRMGAYLLFLVAALHAFQARGSGHGGFAALVAAAVTLQAAVGIATLVLVVPLHLALIHQLGAVIALWLAVVHLRRVRGGPPRPALRETAAAA